MPKYSLIIPVFNVYPFLETCVSSVAAQTFRDFEILLVDDGSTDGSAALCDELAETDCRIRLIHQENKGLGGARNTGIAHASGEYIWCIDSDDYIAPDALERIDAAMESSAADCAVFDLKYVDESGNAIRTEPGFSGRDRCFRLKEAPQMIFAPNAACNKVFRRDVYTDSGLLFPEHLFYEDLATVPLLYPRVERFVSLFEPLYYYVQRRGSIMNSAAQEKRRVADMCFALSRTLEGYKSASLFDAYRDELGFLTIHHAFYLQSVRLIKQQADKQSLERLASFTRENFPDYRKNPYLKTLNGKEKLIFALLDHGAYHVLQKVLSVRGNERTCV